jgi:hypothetical protein
VITVFTKEWSSVGVYPYDFYGKKDTCSGGIFDLLGYIKPGMWSYETLSPYNLI